MPEHKSITLLALHHAEYLLRKEINLLTSTATPSKALDGVLDGWVECVNQQALEIKRLNQLKEESYNETLV